MAKIALTKIELEYLKSNGVGRRVLRYVQELESHNRTLAYQGLELGLKTWDLLQEVQFQKRKNLFMNE